MHDSKEELYFSWWVEELKKEGLIIESEEQIKFVLCKQVERDYIKPMKRVPDKELQEILFNEKVYTADSKLVWNIDHPKAHLFIGQIDDPLYKYNKVLFKSEHLIKPSMVTYVEIKGTFDMNNMTRLFKQNQAFLWETQRVYVNLIKVPGLFEQTFLPERYLLTDKTLKKRVIKFKYLLLKDFLNK